MTRGRAELAPPSTQADLEQAQRDSYMTVRVRVNGHERDLSWFRAAPVFVFPKPYPKPPRPRTLRDLRRESWRFGAAPVEAQEAMLGVVLKAVCPRCRSNPVNSARRQKVIGWTYAACPDCNIIFNY